MTIPMVRYCDIHDSLEMELAPTKGHPILDMKLQLRLIMKRKLRTKRKLITKEVEIDDDPVRESGLDGLGIALFSELEVIPIELKRSGFEHNQILQCMNVYPTCLMSTLML
ncbi:hypothetical protein PVK06_048724 [Gossypium arboreum]|uniref:Uncharacterized protein n=1 Tax=Gossypium arboreum TaxID=29729 RepID=A0ABR0MGT8_GOSAR|nr:hypothetical protein PVK06_048724 [Gossypium arboreum]